MNVMLIDDDPGSLECMTCALQLYGYDVAAYELPDEAIAAYDPKITDLIITDYHLAGASGLDIIKAIRKKNKDAPIIVVSGGIRKNVEPPALKAGATAFFSKPLDIAQLIVKIISLGDK
ncbi:MAG: response regulator [bacterium]|nr:response regulator [bacterium]